MLAAAIISTPKNKDGKEDSNEVVGGISDAAHQLEIEEIRKES